jgi:hypothetical protein
LPYPEAYGELLDKVLHYTPDKNFRDSDGLTVVAHLVYSECTDEEFERRLRILVEHGADTNLTDRHGTSPLLHCLTAFDKKVGTPRARSTSILRVNPGTSLRLREDEIESIMFKLCKNYSIQDQDTLFLLKQFMAPYDEQGQRDLAQRSHRNWCTASCAARFGKLKSLKYLIDHGVDINWVGPKCRQTCLDYALESAEVIREDYLELLTERLIYVERDTFEESIHLLDEQHLQYYNCPLLQDPD